MTKSNTLSSRLAAAFSALTLSLVLLSGTVSVPSTARAHDVSAYLGQVA